MAHLTERLTWLRYDELGSFYWEICFILDCILGGGSALEGTTSDSHTILLLSVLRFADLVVLVAADRLQSFVLCVAVRSLFQA